MKEIDPYTYGNSDAAVTLTRILNKNSKCIKYVSRTWADYTLGMNNLDKMESPIKSYLMTVWEEHFISIISNSDKMPEDVKSYFLNIIKARRSKSHKKAWLEYGNPKKEKIQ